MSKRTRDKIAYWFLLVIGILGICLQVYKYANDNLLPDSSNSISYILWICFLEFCLTLVFCVFIFHPKKLLGAFSTILKYFTKNA